MLKILHLTLHLNIGGREKLIVGLNNRLNQLGYFSAIACLKHSGELSTQLLKKTEVKEFKKRDAVDLSIVWGLIKYIKFRKFDIIHCHNPGTLLYGYLAGKLSGNKIVINTEHGFVTEKTLLGKLKDKLLYNLVDGITVVSKKLKKDLGNQYKINSNKIKVVSNGIETSIVKENKDRSRKRLGLYNKGYYYIGIVARLTKVKNHLMLLKAIKAINNENITIRLLIVGSGEEKINLEEFVKKNTLSKNVIFMGDRNDIPTILNAIDLFVLSSKSEGLSMAILEAMSAGLPVIATDVGGNNELIKNEENGILVPSNDSDSMADAIRRVIRNKNLAKKFGTNGKEKFNLTFTIEIMTEKFLDLYLSQMCHR